MLNRTTGRELLEYMEQENMKDPQIQLSFTEYAKRKSNVDLKIIASPEDPKVLNFLAKLYTSNFAPNIESKDIQVNMGYTILHCRECKTQGYTMSKDNCLSGGRYCLKPIDGADRSIGGEVLLVQAIKNNCTEKILRESNRMKDLMEYYWGLNTSCIKSFSPRCPNSILTKLGIKDKVFKCIKNSFIPIGNRDRPSDYQPKISLEDNEILIDQKAKFNEIENYNNFPMIQVNGWIFHGDVEYNQIMHFICNHINDNLGGCYTMIERYSEGGSSFKWISFFIVVALVVGAIVYCRKNLKLKFRNELSYHIDKSVSNYLQRNGTDL